MQEIFSLKSHINQIPMGSPFTIAGLARYASSANIRQTLCRLVKSGELERLSQGIYIRPKKSTLGIKSLPSPRQIAETVAKNSGEIIGINGAEAALRLQLSTQVPMKPIFYTTGNTRRIKVGKLEITLKHISPKKLVNPGTPTEVVISALWYLGKAHVNTRVIEKIEKQLAPKDFEMVLKNVANMPAWMADVFYHYQKEKSNELF